MVLTGILTVSVVSYQSSHGFLGIGKKEKHVLFFLDVTNQVNSTFNKDHWLAASVTMRLIMGVIRLGFLVILSRPRWYL